jgi:hypothetical protein
MHNNEIMGNGFSQMEATGPTPKQAFYRLREKVGEGNYEYAFGTGPYWEESEHQPGFYTTNVIVATNQGDGSYIRAVIQKRRSSSSRRYYYKAWFGVLFEEQGRRRRRQPQRRRQQNGTRQPQRKEGYPFPEEAASVAKPCNY